MRRARRLSFRAPGLLPQAGAGQPRFRRELALLLLDQADVQDEFPVFG